MDKTEQEALDVLIRLFKKQGFISSNDIINVTDKFGFTTQEVNRLLDDLAMSGVLIYDKPATDLIEIYIEILNEKAIIIKEIKGGIGVEQENSTAREKFQVWIENRFSNKKEMAKNTLTALDIINMRSRKKELLEDELYEITDISEIEQLIEEIVLNPSLLEINSRGEAYAFYSALETYHKFLGKNSGDDIESMLIAFLDEHGVEHVDNRGMAGSFWIIGGNELEGIVAECRSKFKVRFHYNPTPKAKSLKKRAGWWTTDLPKL